MFLLSSPLQLLNLILLKIKIYTNVYQFIEKMQEIKKDNKLPHNIYYL